MVVDMRNWIRLGIVILAGIVAACAPKHEDARKWYKGNLHTHSYWSDGDEFPEMIMDWYKSHGYHFIGLSDHNTFAKGEKWVKIQHSKLYEDGFAEYLAKFGPDWVIYRTDSERITVKLKTLAEYRPRFEDTGFIMIPSEEVTAKLDKKPIHMNVTNIRTLILPPQGSTVLEIMQKNVDSVYAQRQRTGVPMFPHVNHPNFYYGVSLQDLIDLRGERFFEVYNGHPLVRNYGDSLHPGTEEMWDKINIAYLKRNQPLMYGLATDDSHNYHQFGAAYSNAGRGWVMVLADSLKPGSLIQALEVGNFYASTGVTLEKLEQSDHLISIKVKAEPGVKYTIEFIGAKKNTEETTVLSKTVATEANFQLTDEYQFVRARVTSDKLKPNPYQERDFEMAWTQPMVK